MVNIPPNGAGPPPPPVTVITSTSVKVTEEQLGSTVLVATTLIVTLEVRAILVINKFPPLPLNLALSELLFELSCNSYSTPTSLLPMVMLADDPEVIVELEGVTLSPVAGEIIVWVIVLEVGSQVPASVIMTKISSPLIKVDTS